MPAFNHPMAYANVIYRLGLGNVIRVVLYKLALKSGYFRWKCPIQAPIEGSFFTIDLAAPNNDILNTINYFSAHPIEVDDTPKWFNNPWKKNDTCCNSDAHWSAIPDFSAAVGDIKTIWEPSRFDWMPQLAWQAIEEESNPTTISTLETWMRDWLARNQPNQGINWKCAQEVSLRALNVLLTADLLSQPHINNTESFLRFFSAHIERILPTTLYAKAQNNNHGTSEAVALFCVGLFLISNGNKQQQTLGRRAAQVGRSFLENRICTLILSDGSFSQLSVNYHRLMLDTVTYCEIYRQSQRVSRFSNKFYSRMQAATNWLAAMVDSVSGDAANLGANDGAYFGNIENFPYRDFRPSLKRSMAVFHDKNLLVPENDAMLDAYAIGYKHLDTAPPTQNSYFPEGGFARVNLPQVNGHFIFRYPKYAFRPPNCDANHLDVWTNGQNLTLDAGSYSYNTENEEYRQYFAGTAGHCTIKFDNRDQMPKLGRMLRGCWLQPAIAEFNGDASTIRSKYKDYMGAWHQRDISITERGLNVRDEFGGFKDNAVLRWRLPNIQWILSGETLDSSLASITLTSTANTNIELCTEKNSLRYLELCDVPVLKATFTDPAVVNTQFNFKAVH